MEEGQRRSLFTLYLAYFADYLNWGVAIAFLGVYIATDTTPFSNLFWNPEWALGISYAAFPIGDIFGSPALGYLSDWIGRKKVLIWGFWGSIFSMLLCAYSLWIGSFALFLLSQFLIGFFSGKQAMAQAAIVEIQAGTTGQKLAFLSVLGGMAWILGPFLGERLMKEPYLSCGGYIWPSLLAAGIYFGCLVYTYFSFKETYRLADRSFTTATFLKTLGTACIGTLRERLFFIFLINLFGWYLLAVSLSNFLIDRFHLSTAQLDHYNNYYSLWFTLGGVVGTAWILHRYRAKHVFFWSTLVGSMGVFLLYNTDRLVELWIYMAIPAITEAWVYPAYQTILSDQTNEQNQGKIFGLIGAANGVCQFVATLMLYGVTSASIVLMSALLFLVSVALLPTLLRKKKEELPA